MSEPRKTILFVDDEANILAGLGRMLRGLRQTMDLQFAASGEQALAVLAAQPVDVLVTDMRMPGMDGLQLQDELSRRGVVLPIIFLTGHGTVPQSVRAIKAGAVNFLTTPVTGTALLESVRSPGPVPSRTCSPTRSSRRSSPGWAACPACPRSTPNCSGACRTRTAP